MNPQNERKKQITIARLSFIILIAGPILTLLAYTIFITRDNENYILILPFIALIVLVVAAVFFNVSAYNRKRAKRFRVFRDQYPNSYLCQPDLDTAPRILAITKDHSDIAIFEIGKKQNTELVRMPMSDITITATDVSTNGILTFAGLQISSDSYEARFVLLDDNSPILKANSSQSYAEEVAKKLSI
jgi:hypothetical protein